MKDKVKEARSQRIKKRQQQRRKRWLLGSLITFGSIIIGLILFLVFNLYKGFDFSSRDGQRDVDIKTEPFTILFVGTDQYDTDDEKSKGYRTDVLMLTAINPKNRSIKLLSIPRDLYTTIPNTDGHRDKINTASFWGQQKGIPPMKNTKKAVEELFDIPVDYYAKINFKGFIEIVNAVGGVDVNVKKDFQTTTFGGKTVYFQKGPMHLTGEEALPYVRMRKDDVNESGRNERQQEVISQVIDRLTAPQNIHKIPEIIAILGDNISYDIKINDTITLANTWKRIPKENMEIIQFDRQNGLLEDYITLNGVRRNFVYKLTEEERLRVSNLLKQQLEIPIEQGEVYQE